MKQGWRWTWTNWTFGVWWSARLRAWGVDLGPAEYVRRQRR